MIDATSTLCGNASLMRRSRGSHQSSGLSEISSQFHEEWSAVFARFSVDTRELSIDERRNFVFGPLTLMTGCMPIVLTTTPPQPASKARRMLESDSVGGADARRNGFSNSMPVNRVESMDVIGVPLERRIISRVVVGCAHVKNSSGRAYSGEGGRP